MMSEDIPAGLNAADYQCAGGPNVEAAIAKLEKTGFTGFGRADRAPLKVGLPFDWNGTDPTDRNWMFQLHAWRMLDPYLRLMVKGAGDEASFRKCAAVIRDWARDNILGKAGDFTWYDMSTGIRASKLALMARAGPRFQRDITEIPGFGDMLTGHFTQLMNPKKLSPGNHGLFQMQGLKSLASAFPDHPASSAATSYAVKNMIELIRSQLGRHGVHTEHSPDYHFIACGRIALILRSPDWRIPETRFALNLLGTGDKAKAWLVDCENRILPVGDSGQSVIKADMTPALTKWPHQSSLHYQGAVLDGYAVIRSRPEVSVDESSYLFLTASYHSMSHKHDDCLSLVWKEGGQDILIDPGKYSYQRDVYRSYFVGRSAHNTVEFNGLSLPKDKRPPYGSGVENLALGSDGGWEIRAQAACSAEGDIHSRKVLFHPGRKLIVFDRVAAAGADINDYTIWWHFPESARVEIGRGACVIAGLADERSLRMRYASSADETTPHLHIGETKPRVQGWYSPGYMRREPAPALGLSASASGVFEAVTVFEWGDDGASGRDADDPGDLSPAERSLLDAAR